MGSEPGWRNLNNMVPLLGTVTKSVCALHQTHVLSHRESSLVFLLSVVYCWGCSCRCAADGFNLLCCVCRVQEQKETQVNGPDTSASLNLQNLQNKSGVINNERELKLANDHYM